MRIGSIAIVTAGLACAGWWLFHHPLGRAIDEPGARPTVTAQDRNLPIEQSTSEQRDRELERSEGEIAELRARLREREKLLSALLVQAVRPDKPAPLAPVRENPTERAIGVLDERLFRGTLSGPDVQKNEAAVRTAMSDLPDAVKATIKCSTELCRVTVAGPDTELTQPCGKLIEHLPKAFAGGIVLSEGNGQRAVFTATRRELLATADPPTSR
jgi:hypothetical protein